MLKIVLLHRTNQKHARRKQSSCANVSNTLNTGNTRGWHNSYFSAKLTGRATLWVICGTYSNFGTNYLNKSLRLSCLEAILTSSPSRNNFLARQRYLSRQYRTTSTISTCSCSGSLMWRRYFLPRGSKALLPSSSYSVLREVDPPINAKIGLVASSEPNKHSTSILIISGLSLAVYLELSTATKYFQSPCFEAVALQRLDRCQRPLTKVRYSSRGLSGCP